MAATNLAVLLFLRGIHVCSTAYMFLLSFFTLYSFFLFFLPSFLLSLFFLLFFVDVSFLPSISITYFLLFVLLNSSPPPLPPLPLVFFLILCRNHVKVSMRAHAVNLYVCAGLLVRVFARACVRACVCPCIICSCVQLRVVGGMGAGTFLPACQKTFVFAKSYQQYENYAKCVPETTFSHCPMNMDAGVQSTANECFQMPDEGHWCF